MSQTNPAEAARAALRRIAELKLPPTPDNFQRYYFEPMGGEPRSDGATRAPQRDGIAVADGVAARDGALRPTPDGHDGASPTTASEPVDAALLTRIERLVGSAVDTAGGLSDGLASGGRSLETNLEQLVADGDLAEGPATRLLREIAMATHEIRQLVQSSHAELVSTQRGLATVQAELAESRRLLAQDPLTGSDNRRSMEGILRREIEATRRDEAPLAVAMIDLDHFKSINDHHGHAVGDAALIHLTQIARALLRGNDSFVRYGGDEFLLVLPDTDLRGGVIAGERLQAMLMRQPLVQGDLQIALTLSGGVACLQDGEDGAALLARADSALYRAKRDGRGRVLSA